MQAVDLVGLDLQFAGIFMFQQSGLQPVQETGQDIGADIGSPEKGDHSAGTTAAAQDLRLGVGCVAQRPCRLKHLLLCFL